MKAKKIILKNLLALLLLASCCLYSCERRKWCIDCYWDCDVQPLFSDERTLCGDTPEDCEARLNEFMGHRVVPDCWVCGDMYEN